MIIVDLVDLQHAVEVLKLNHVTQVGIYRRRARPDQVILACAVHRQPQVIIQGKLIESGEK